MRLVIVNLNNFFAKMYVIKVSFMLIQNVGGLASTVDKLDACVVFHCNVGAWNIFRKMSLEKARTFFDYLYNYVAKIIENAQGYLLPKLEKITQQCTIKRGQGSHRTRTLNHNDDKSVCQKTLKSPLKSTLQITWEAQTSRGVNVSKSTAYRILRKTGIEKAQKFPSLTEIRKDNRVNVCRNWLLDNFFDNVFTH